jgi:hypothetical protein
MSTDQKPHSPNTKGFDWTQSDNGSAMARPRLSLDRALRQTQKVKTPPSRA